MVIVITLTSGEVAADHRKNKHHQSAAIGQIHTVLAVGRCRRDRAVLKVRR
jgi:hypothetical protein